MKFLYSSDRQAWINRPVDGPDGSGSSGGSVYAFFFDGSERSLPNAMITF